MRRSRFLTGLQPVSFAINLTTNKIYVAGGQSNGDVTVIDGATGGTAHVAIHVRAMGVRGARLRRDQRGDEHNLPDRLHVHQSHRD